MSNVGRHGSSRLSSKAPLYQPLLALRANAGVCAGRPSVGGRRTAAAVPPGSRRRPRGLSVLRRPAHRSLSASKSLACQRTLVRGAKSRPSLCEPSVLVAPKSGPAHRSFSASRSFASQTRLFSQAGQGEAGVSARCRLEESQSTLHVMQVAASCSSSARADLLLSTTVSLFFACPPTPPSSGRPSAAAHVER